MKREIKRLFALLVLFAVAGQLALAADGKTNLININSVNENSVTIQYSSKDKAVNLATIRKSSAKAIDKIGDFKLAPAKSIDMKGKALGNTPENLFSAAAESFEMKIIGLEGNTAYSIDVFTAGVRNSVEFKTVAPEPKKQASALGFMNVTDESMTVRWNKGDGEGRIVVASLKENVPAPKDGTTYTADAKWGTAAAKIGEGFVVYKGNGTSVELTNLPTGKFYFQVFEYNGNDASVNYNTMPAASNPRAKATGLKAPVLKEASEVTSNSCKFTWGEVDGAEKYLLDVSKDKSFKELIEYYNNSDIGNLTEMEIAVDEPGTYYIRLRAAGEGVMSKNSNVLEVEMK